MVVQIVLASGSAVRARMLEAAAVPFDVIVPRVDEDMIRRSMIADGAGPRDVADGLAEAKARKISARFPGAMVIGCDQVAEFQGEILSKPVSPDDAIGQLRRMRGDRHRLFSAAVVYEAGAPVWRHVGVVRLVMRAFSDAYLQGYVDRNWDSIRHSVGAYKLEEEGVRLFSRIEGDHFHVLGLPLLELLGYLHLKGVIDS
ncbi:Maf family protein [Pukyongiella litopenaei]|uniref:Nucleoside triphosphate pyrophosphatase n=1 Tax=Pukyongiella litopenaei TaxID=2605946 RepID=A0A2S0MQ56_9RHOB|nr:nucleoside triphosphate pyrophosphatase [Pukyongiella litopenaei]AVO37843.1 Maf-like protein [Pukyongiella litopenaei]